MGGAPSAAWTNVAAVMNKRGVELYHIMLTVRAHKEGDQWAAFCEELGVHSCGDSVEEAIANAIEATFLYLNGIEQLDERRRVFDERGIKPELGLPKPDETHREIPVGPDEYVTRMVAAVEPASA